MRAAAVGHFRFIERQNVVCRKAWLQDSRCGLVHTGFVEISDLAFCPGARDLLAILESNRDEA